MFAAALALYLLPLVPYLPAIVAPWAAGGVFEARIAADVGFQRSLGAMLLASAAAAVFLGALVSLPFKRCMRAIRTQAIEPSYLSKPCRTHLRRTPLYHCLAVAVPLVAFAVLATLFAWLPVAPVDVGSAGSVLPFAAIAIFGASSSALTVYQWQRRRVEVLYVTRLFDSSELEERSDRVGRTTVARRLLLAAVSGVGLPITIIAAYGIVTRLPLAGMPETAVGPSPANAVEAPNLFVGIGAGAILAVVTCVLSMWWVADSVRLPVDRLGKVFRRSDGDRLDLRVAVTSSDEIGGLSESANQLLSRLARRMVDQRLAQAADHLYVPSQALAVSAKLGAGDGEAREGRMSVLVVRTLGFRSFARAVGVGRLYEYMAQAQQVMEPAVRDLDGFVYRYGGASAVALFPGATDRACHAARALSSGLRHAARRWRGDTPGVPPLSFEFGVHTGVAALGVLTAGGAARAVVISDAVAFASELAGCAGVYGTPIIVSKATREGLVEPEAFGFRPLDLVRLDDRAMPIYELLTATPADDAKRAGLPRFMAAQKRYRHGDIRGAVALFEQVLSQNPEDGPVAFLVNRCRALAAGGVPEGWSPVTTTAALRRG